MITYSGRRRAGRNATAVVAAVRMSTVVCVCGCCVGVDLPLLTDSRHLHGSGTIGGWRPCCCSVLMILILGMNTRSGRCFRRRLLLVLPRSTARPALALALSQAGAFFVTKLTQTQPLSPCRAITVCGKYCRRRHKACRSKTYRRRVIVIVVEVRSTSAATAVEAMMVMVVMMLMRDGRGR